MKKDQLLDSLKRVPLLADLSRKDLERVAADGREEMYSPGQDIVTEGDSGGPFFMLLEGRAQILKGGKVRRTLEPGTYFGEMSLLDGQPRSATVKAEEPTTTFALTSWQFLPLLAEYPSISRALLVELCARLRRVEQDPVS